MSPQRFLTRVQRRARREKPPDEILGSSSRDVTAFNNDHQRFLGGIPALLAAGSSTLRSDFNFQCKKLCFSRLICILAASCVTQSQRSTETSVQSALRQAAVSFNLPLRRCRENQPKFCLALTRRRRIPMHGSSRSWNSTEVREPQKKKEKKKTGILSLGSFCKMPSMAATIGRSRAIGTRPSRLQRPAA